MEMAYSNNKNPTHVIILPTKPRCVFAKLVKLEPVGALIEISAIKIAVYVMTIHANSMMSDAKPKPSFAEMIGNAKIPAPISVPVMIKILPNCF